MDRAKNGHVIFSKFSQLDTGRQNSLGILGKSAFFISITILHLTFHVKHSCSPPSPRYQCCSVQYRDVHRMFFLLPLNIDKGGKGGYRNDLLSGYRFYHHRRHILFFSQQFCRPVSRLHFFGVFISAINKSANSLLLSTLSIVPLFLSISNHS